jgi:hypothetical protein
MSQWTKPRLVEIDMSAEIGAYQDDLGDDRNTPVIATDDPVDAAERD